MAIEADFRRALRNLSVCGEWTVARSDRSRVEGAETTAYLGRRWEKSYNFVQSQGIVLDLSRSGLAQPSTA
jgi:hypothetical protein